MTRTITVWITLVCLALYAAPASAKSKVFIKSEHKLVPIVSGDTTAYARLRSRAPLRLSVAGPGTLLLRMRQGFPTGLTPSKSSTQVAIFVGRRQVKRVTLKGPASGKVRGARLRVGRSHSFRVHLKRGRHLIRVQIVGKRDLVLLSYKLQPLHPRPEEPALVGLGAPPEALAPIALVGLGAPPEAAKSPALAMDAIPLASLSDPSPSGLPDIPLVGLGEAGTPAPTSDGTVSLAAIPLVDLAGEPAPSEHPVLAQAGQPVAVDTLPAGDHSTASGFVSWPADPGAKGLADSRSGPSLTPGHAVLGLRGLAAKVGLGSGVLGGGVDLLLRPGLLNNQLLVGLSLDYLPQRFTRSVPLGRGAPLQLRASLDTVPVLLTGAYLMGHGRLRYRADAGVGVAWTRIASGGLSKRGLRPAGALAFGPLLALGPGWLTASLRLSASVGGLGAPQGTDTTSMLSGGGLGSLGLTLGYSLEL